MFKNGDICGEILGYDKNRKLGNISFPPPHYLGDNIVFLEINYSVAKILDICWYYGCVLQKKNCESLVTYWNDCVLFSELTVEKIYGQSKKSFNTLSIDYKETN